MYWRKNILGIAGIVSLLALLGVTTGHSQGPAGMMTPVKYDELKQEVIKLRGKVVVVDLWGSSCIACMKAFPTFVDMHKKYAGKGFHMITVLTDAADNPDRAKTADAFLRQKNPPFRNLLLAESPEVLEKKLECHQLPCYFVFDRQGKWVRFGGKKSENDIDYRELEKIVVHMLDEK